MAPKRKVSTGKATRKAKSTGSKNSKSTSKTTKKQKTTSQKSTVAEKTVAKKVGKISKPYTKSELYAILSEHTAVPKKQVIEIFNKFSEIIAAHMEKGGPEKFVLPGILKMTVKSIPARKAREGISPFTGQPMVFKAKPASKKVKIAALRALKDMVA